MAKTKRENILQTDIFPLDPKSHRRMCVFAILSLFLTVFSVVCIFFKTYISYIDNNIPTAGFFKYFIENATILDFGSVIISPAVQTVSGVLFLIFCCTAKKRKMGPVIIPSIITAGFLLVWNAIIEISIRMGVLRDYTVNWYGVFFVVFFAVLFILTFIGSNNGKIKYSLLAKILTIVFGSVLIAIPFNGVYRTFMSITESATTLHGITYVLLGLVSSLFFSFSCLTSQIAVFVCVFSIRRNPENSEVGKG